MDSNLNQAIEDAKTTIETYESDTFSASYQGVTPEEIESMIAVIIERKIQRIGGIELMAALDLIRSNSL